MQIQATGRKWQCRNCQLFVQAGDGLGDVCPACGWSRYPRLISLDRHPSVDRNSPILVVTGGGEAN